MLLRGRVVGTGARSENTCPLAPSFLLPVETMVRQG